MKTTIKKIFIFLILITGHALNSTYNSNLRLIGNIIVSFYAGAGLYAIFKITNKSEKNKYY